MIKKRLNEVNDKWSEFSDDYYIGDDGNFYHNERKLKQTWYRSPLYPYCCLRCKFGTKKQHTVKTHQAVAYAFLPPGEGEIDHINGKKDDNRAENLRRVTHKENIRLKKYHHRTCDHCCPVCGAQYWGDEVEWKKEETEYGTVNYHNCPCCGAEIIGGYE